MWPLIYKTTCVSTNNALQTGIGEMRDIVPLPWIKPPNNPVFRKVPSYCKIYPCVLDGWRLKIHSTKQTKRGRCAAQNPWFPPLTVDNRGLRQPKSRYRPIRPFPATPTSILYLSLRFIHVHRKSGVHDQMDFTLITSSCSFHEMKSY